MSIEPASLPSARYRRMVERMRDAWIAENKTKHGWKAAIARELNVTGQYVGYIESGEREAGLDAVNDAIARLGIASEYFHSPKLGTDPDHTKFIGTRVERDTARSPYPDFEAFIAAMVAQDAITEGQIRALRGLRYTSSTVKTDLALAREELGQIVREQSGRAILRPVDPENVVDEAAGQTVVARRRPKKR